MYLLSTGLLALGTVLGFQNCSQTTSPSKSLSSTSASQSINYCQLADGTTVINGATVTAYLAPLVPIGQTCQSQQDTCLNEVLSGTYQFSSCSVVQAVSCSINGMSIASGSSITVYPSSTVGFGQTCTGQSLSCNNGTLSGSSYTVTSCSVPTCAGSTVGNACWYLGALGQSCDAVCANHGGYSAATETYAGTNGGSASQCQSVLSTLGIGTANQAAASACGNFALGCATYDVGMFFNGADAEAPVYCSASQTTSSASVGPFKRACACQN